MCGFKPGDEVVAIKSDIRLDLPKGPIPVGFVGHVRDVCWSEKHQTWGVHLAEIDVPSRCGTVWTSFKKVERKSDSLSIEAFRTIKDGAYEEPRRTNQPDKRKEQA